MKHYKYLIWHGVVTKVECKDHSYAWTGSMPCTGILACIYCGKESYETLRRNPNILAMEKLLNETKHGTTGRN